MLGTHFYNKSTNKVIVAFGTVFNNIQLKTEDPDGTVITVQKVPLAYGPKQKFLSRLEQNTQTRKTSITLPRLYFEMTGISYDPTRHLTPCKQLTEVKQDDGTSINIQYVPVPYNLSFEAGIIAKSQTDALQILEQILPFFQPSLNVSVKFVPGMQEAIRDVPINLDSISYDDTWDGDFKERRYITYTLFFTVKSYYYGPKSDSAIIRNAIIKEYATTNIETPGRYRQYSVTPKALTDTTSDPSGPDAGAPDGVIDSFDDNALTGDDDFGFNEIVTFSEDV